MEDSSDSDDSNLDELLDGDMEQMVVLLAAKELEDRKNKRQQVGNIYEDHQESGQQS
jgi:hypothetical protein